MFKNILILCLGNICRSPLAEVLLREKAKAAGLMISVDSAGLSAMVGDGAHPFSQKIGKAYGLLLEDHIAKQVTPTMVKAADLILVMDDHQRHTLEHQFQAAAGKTFRLGHFSHFDIPDPYGQTEAVFGSVYQLIDQAVTDWLAQLG